MSTTMSWRADALQALELLPRLAYIGDTPVGGRPGCPDMLAGLLGKYPGGKLRLCVSNFHGGAQPMALNGAGIERFRTRWPLPAFAWLEALQTTAALRRAPRRVHRLLPRLAEFKPGAILSVVDGPSWLVAAGVAARLGVPLHLVVHDHFQAACNAWAPYQPWLKARFIDACRVAATRFCASPAMVEFCRKTCSIEGTVLYPCRTGAGKSLPPQLGGDSRAFTVGCATAAVDAGTVDLVVRMARALAEIGGRLIVCSPRVPAVESPNIEWRERLAPSTMFGRLGADADVMWLPVSFAPSDAQRVRVGFSYDLPDASAAGLPLLVWGPDDCTAVHWARRNPGVAEVLDSMDENALRETLLRLKNDPAHRMGLARRAGVLGDGLFSLDTAWRVFSSSLLSPVDAAPARRAA